VTNNLLTMSTVVRTSALIRLMWVFLFAC